LTNKIATARGCANIQLAPLTSGPHSHHKPPVHDMSSYHYINIWSSKRVIVIRLSIHVN